MKRWRPLCDCGRAIPRTGTCWIGQDAVCSVCYKRDSQKPEHRAIVKLRLDLAHRAELVHDGELKGFLKDEPIGWGSLRTLEEKLARIEAEKIVT